tara:strand:+ start:342 stop:1445 length:1104 start_codon:yes stop_codon:yes gene_type:complete
MNKNIYFSDLFCGAGGISLGFMKAGLKPALVSDNWEKSEINFKLNKKLKKVKFLRSDLSQRKNIKLISKLLKNIDILAGGPPCQGFSTLGKRKTNDKRNSLVDSFLEIIKLSRPKIIVMENVPGLRSMKRENGVKYLDYVKKYLKKIEYEFTEIVLDGKHFKMAQTRKRVFILAFNSKFFKKDILEKVESIFQKQINKNSTYSTLEKKIKDLPKIKSGEGEDVTKIGSKLIFNHKSFNHGEELLSKLKYVKPNGGLLDVPRRLLNNHLKNVVDGKYGSGGLIKNIYGRMDWKKPSGTIVAGIRKITCGRFIHPDFDRLLSPRECARIQGFDDDYLFHGSLTDQYTLIGNSVPPQFSKFIGTLLKTIA